VEDIRNKETSGIHLIDDWCSLEECKYLVWAFEYDGEEKTLWDEVKQGEGHFPRQMLSFLKDPECKSSSFLYHIRERMLLTAKEKCDNPILFGGQSMMEAIVDSSFIDALKDYWQRNEVILFLNDDFEGGEIEFPDKQVQVTPRAASLLVFPSSENWVTKEIKGNSYRMRLKLTDSPEFREEDANYGKIPFDSRKTPYRKKKSKGCGSCGSKDRSGQVKVEVHNPKTGETQVIWKDKNVVEGKAPAPKKIII
jgi:hypothetical protein